MEDIDLTKIIYMDSIESCYVKEFEAKVLESNIEEKWVILDKTAFYPVGGGQPSDIGMFKWNEESTKVTKVKKQNDVLHYIDEHVPPKSSSINCFIDWDRRYSHMKMHTSQHLLSAVIWKNFKSATVGNQIHSDRSHIDFHPASFNLDELKKIENEVNDLIKEGHDVTMKELPRSFIEEKMESERVDLSRLPSSVKKLRTIMIGNEGEIDICPCAGTHIANIGEIGEMHIVRRKSKGSGKVRVEYELV
jgi:misacylated tRNA(Ala) deacylase